MRRSAAKRAAELATAPVAEAKAVSALARFRQGRKLTGSGRLPETGEEFVWRLLSGAEEDAAVAAAVLRLSGLGLPVELRAYADLEAAITWETLAIAMRDPSEPDSPSGEKYPRPLCNDSTETRELLSDTEREILYSDYLDFVESVDPDPADIDPAVLVAITEAVKKKEFANLSAHGSRALASYLLITDSQPSNSPNGSSGSGA